MTNEQGSPVQEPVEGLTERPGDAIVVNRTELVEFIEYPFKGIAVTLTWLDTPGNSGPKRVELADRITDGMVEEPELSNVAA
jgi:hypothetical protein